MGVLQLKKNSSIGYWEELVGIFESIEIDDLTFRVNLHNHQLVLTSDSKEARVLGAELTSKFEGMRVGLLRTDLPEKPILVRVIACKDHAAE